MDWTQEKTDKYWEGLLMEAARIIPHKSPSELHRQVGAICGVTARCVYYWYNPRRNKRLGVSKKLHPAMALAEFIIQNT